MSTTLISAETYLKTSYTPDMELINGELREKPMPSRLHGYAQMLIGHWFLNHKTQWGVVPESEVRTEVRPGNFRLPDVSITRLGTFVGKTQQNPPLIAIEILSEDDRFSDLERRASDLEAMGVRHTWLIDPERRLVWRWSLQEHWVSVRELQAENGVYLDLDWLWTQLEEYQADNI